MALRVTLFRAHEQSVAGKNKNTLFCSIPMSMQNYIGWCSEKNNSTKWNQEFII